MALMTRSELDQFVKARRDIATGVKRSVKPQLEALDYSDIATARDNAFRVMNGHLVDGTNASAELSAELYNTLRERALGEPTDVDVYSGYDPNALYGATKAIIQKEVDGNHTAFINGCMNRVDYEIQRASGECMYHNGYKDRSFVKYMRVPAGHETCAFCIMLASRGAVYYSAETAGERKGHYHSNCDCAIMPVFLGAGMKATDIIEGHDPEEWKAKYYELRDEGVLDESKLREASRKAQKRHGYSVNRTAGTEGTQFPSGSKAMIRYIQEATSQEDLERRANVVSYDYNRYWKGKRDWTVIKRAIDKKERSFKR